MDTQHQRSLTELINLLNSGANFYRQAEYRFDNLSAAGKFKPFVRAREISVHELEPYIAAIAMQSGSASIPGHGEDGLGDEMLALEETGVDKHLDFETFERMEGEMLAALDQAIQIPASQSLRTLLSEIRGRTSACCYNLRQMRQAEA